MADEQYKGWNRRDMARLAQLKMDPLWTQSYEDQKARLMEYERKVRQERRRELLEEFLKRPRIGLARLVMYATGRMHAWAATRIAESEEAEIVAAFEAAAEARKKSSREAVRCDAHVRDRHTHILSTEQGYWWLAKKEQDHGPGAIEQC